MSLHAECRDTGREGRLFDPSAIGPEQVDPPTHDVGGPGRLPGHVVLDAPVLETIGPPLVAAHARPDLRGPAGGLGRMAARTHHVVESRDERRHRLR